jgi:hypothetical protein
MIKSITFTEDFANRKKGEVWADCDYQLASHLVNVDEVAIYTEEVTTEEVTTKTTKKGK